MSEQQDWQSFRVGDLIVHHASGPSPTCDERNVASPEEWGLLKTTAVTWNGWNPNEHKVPPSSFWGNSALEIHEGDVLITKAGPRERCGVSVYVLKTPERLMASGKMVLLRPDKSRINAVILASALATEKSQRYLDSRTTGMADAQLNFTNELLLGTQLEIPSLSEQEKITKVLIAVDRLIEKTKALIAKYQAIKQGMMHDLFTRGVDKNGHLRPPYEQAPELYKESVIGWIPEGWEVNKISEIAMIIDPNPSHRYPSPVDVGVPILSTENFDGPSGFDLKKASLVEEWVFEEQNKRCQFHEKDVVFARKGRLGFARPYGKERKVFSHTVVLIKPLVGQATHEYLLWLLQSAGVFEEIRHHMNSNSGVPTLGVEFLGNVRVAMPSTREQALMANSLDALDAQIEAEKTNLVKQKKLKIGLMQDLLAGKIRVNTSVNPHRRLRFLK